MAAVAIRRAQRSACGMQSPLGSTVAVATLILFILRAFVSASEQDSQVCNENEFPASNPFVRVESDLRNSKYEPREILFNFELYSDQNDQDQLPKSLPIPDFVRVFEFVQHRDPSMTMTLAELGKSAREVIDDNLPSSGAVLFRNLNQRITNATEFAEFWEGVMKSKENDKWMYMKHDPASNSCYRSQLHGVDLTAAVPPDVLLRLHNEMAYNPRPNSRIALYCLQDGDGGQTPIGRNAEFTKRIPANVKSFIEAHGGVLYKRYYYNVTNPEEKNCLSWQEKTGATTKEEAILFYTTKGFKEDDIIFNEKGDMIISFIHPGYIRDEETGEDVWFNHQHHNPGQMADGTDMPPDMLTGLVLAMWKSAYAVRLEPGDWLVMDNLKVMHGRFPYKDVSPDKPRTLLAVYTE